MINIFSITDIIHKLTVPTSACFHAMIDIIHIIYWLNVIVLIKTTDSIDFIDKIDTINIPDSIDRIVCLFVFLTLMI